MSAVVTPPVLLGSAAVLFAVCAGATILLLRTDTTAQGAKDRIDAVAALSRPKAIAAVMSLTRKDVAAAPGWKESLTGFLGFSLSRTDQHTMKWYIVVALSLLAGRIAAWLASGLFGSLSWVLLPVVTVVVCRSQFSTMAQKRINKLRAQFPDALGLIVRAVRVGVPVSEALRAVGRDGAAPTAGEFDRLAHQIGIGMSLEAGLRDMADRNDLPEYGFFAAALALQAQTGGGLAETLDLLADVTRKRVAMQARGHALSSEARTSSMILGGLPLVAGLGLYAVNADYMMVLFVDPSGQMILGAAILSLSIGMFVMRTIIRKSLAV